MSSIRVIALALFIALTVVLTFQYAPRCKPDDHRSIYIGNMLVAGCPG